MSATTSSIRCGHCLQKMQSLVLKNAEQTEVSVIACPSCLVFWCADGVRPKLAPASQKTLLQYIDQALRQAKPSSSALQLQCPSCKSQLPQFDADSCGNFGQLSCAEGHGFFQSMLGYLHENNLLRLYRWQDVAHLKDSGMALHCANCSLPVSRNAQSACPHCQTTLGVLDPGQLDLPTPPKKIAVENVKLDAASKEANALRCWKCGFSMDAQDQRCPQCQAVRRVKLPSANTTPASVAAAQALMDEGLLRTPDGENDDIIGKPRGKRFSRLVLGLAFFLVMGSVLVFSRWSTPNKEKVALKRSNEATLQLIYDNSPHPCVPEGDERKYVKLRYIATSVGTFHGAMIEGYRALEDAEAALKKGEDFDAVRERYGAAHLMNEIDESKEYARGELPRAIDAVAFCVAIDRRSKIFKDRGAFYLLQVVAAR